MNIVIIKYNAGNTCSVNNALLRLGVNAIISDDAATIQQADKVIFPGVGAAAPAMRHLRENGLDKLITGLQQPFLGICLGMQLLCNHSEEGDTECLGVFDAPVQLFNSVVKVPQMGWNNISDLQSPLFSNIGEAEWMYFVHGYYVPLHENTIGSASYGTTYSAALHRDNFYAVQFHPEKSGAAGQKLIENFITL
jgi:imidazole glycerol-phosphate synthase subunit HisH